MSDPVIILAPPRSFTSVACAMLGQHPQLYGLPEVNLPVAETMREREGVIQRPPWSEHGLLRAVAQVLGGEQTTRSVELAREWVGIRADCSCVSVFSELAELVQPRRLVDKSPRNVTQVEYLRRIHAAFPGARFLHLVRHPRGQGESVAKLGGAVAANALGGMDHGTDPPTVDFQKAWYRLNVNILVFLAGVPRDQQLRMRGEDLLADPDRQLRILAEWLGLRADVDAIEAMKHPEASPYACPGPPGARFGNDPGFLEDPALRPRNGSRPEPVLDGPLSWRDDGAEFTDEVRALARELGYH
jgi:hypothetical protein